VHQHTLEDMVVRKFGEKTRYDYIRHVTMFSKFLGRSPEAMVARALWGGWKRLPCAFCNATRMLPTRADKRLLDLRMPDVGWDQGRRSMSPAEREEWRKLEWILRRAAEQRAKGPEDPYYSMRRLFLHWEREREGERPTGRDSEKAVDNFLRDLGIKPRKPVKVTKPMSFFLPIRDRKPMAFFLPKQRDA
jgi:hypothetical protein